MGPRAVRSGTVPPYGGLSTQNPSVSLSKSSAKKKTLSFKAIYFTLNTDSLTIFDDEFGSKNDEKGQKHTSEYTSTPEHTDIDAHAQRRTDKHTHL